ncbi:hypothetical protein ACT4S5_07680 [Kocuria oceani]|uniref:hypothetical protein n=1 Tax=Kocuria oceani TaxID=988827 RepID=UPI004035A9B3
MTARVSETVLDSFRLTADSVRDIDALIRRSAKDFVENPVVTYDVIRRDNFRYSLTAVDDVLREPNGTGTAIQSISFQVQHGDELTLAVTFDNLGARFEAESHDRASLIALASGIRSLMRDNMHGRKISENRRLIAEAAPYVAPAITFFALVALAARNSSGLNERYQEMTRQYEEGMLQQAEEDAARMVEQGEMARQEGLRLLDGGTEEEKLDFLIEQSTNMPSDIESYMSYPSGSFPEFPSSPWFYTPIALIFLPALACLIALLSRVLLVPRDERLFLIGQEIGKQQKRDKRRDNAFWSILVGFIVSVVGGFVVYLVTVN